MRAQELWNWLLALEPDFAFLLSLPFLVAAAGLLRYWFDHRRLHRRANPQR
ncbi:MAG: hypothetical protein Q8L49_11155 [Burkholderiaceae bacterium]|nr:hypothetical protein [Burkholderiaceae bacterium]